MSPQHPAECLHEDRWIALKETLARIEDKIDSHHKAIYVGNGTPALQTRVVKMEQILGVLTWASATIGGTVLGMVVMAVIKAVRS